MSSGRPAALASGVDVNATCVTRSGVLMRSPPQGQGLRQRLQEWRPLGAEDPDLFLCTYIPWMRIGYPYSARGNTHGGERHYNLDIACH